MKKLILFLIVLSSLTFAVDVHLFYGAGCSHCATEIEFLDSLEYQDLSIHKHETYFNQDERELFERVSAKYGTEIKGVPTTFIGNKIFVGFSDSIAEDIEEKIVQCLDDECENPVDNLEGSKSSSLTLPAVISAAFVDAINPCAFAVLIILLTTILASKNRKRALFSGLAFSLSIFISYFFMGLGLYSAIVASGLSHNFYLIIAIFAIIIGLFNLKDYFWYGKWFIMEVPKKWRPRLQQIIKSITSVPGAFLVGFVVSLFLLPCTSGPYIVILGLLSKVATRDYAFLLLILYNLIFILPMVVITFLVYFGLTTTEKAERIRQSKLKLLHLIAGLIILAIGVGMLVAIKMGML